MLLQTRFGKFINIMTAMLAGLSTLLYVGITYMDNYGTHIDLWYNKMDKATCFVILCLYLIKIYVSQHRTNELLSIESLLNLLIIVPILALNEDDLHMANDYYVPITISRFSRLIFFCIIMIKFYELGETDVDR